VDAYEDRAIVTVSDKGHGFNGEAADGSDVYASSGRGILFMRALMDSVEFDASPQGGTAVRLTKRLPAGHRPRSDTSGGQD
jgi:anti-sigma regulatory factor (Ser/Thr protein kinase)